MGWPKYLTIFIPLAIALKLAGANETLIFVTSALGVIPTAALMGRATEELAARSGPGIGGFLNVTFSSPPMPGPERAASSSVARPISAAVGITPSAEVKKMIVGETCATSSTIASGMNGTSRYGHPLPVSRKRRRLKEACA